MSVFQEPESSQPPGFQDIQRDLLSSATRAEHGWVKYHDPKLPDLSAIVPQAPSEPLSKNLTRSFRPLPSVNSERRSGNADHPAHKPRHVLCPPETQDLAETEALCQFGQLTKHTADGANERSKLKAARIDLSFKENRSVHSGTALRRRRTTEDVPAGSHAPPAKKPALRIRATDSRLCSGYPRRMQDSPMEEDEPIAGPSRPLLRRPSLTSYVNAAEDSDEEDDGMPSST
ncbi:uncharacterized protein TRAVEDRAFT_73720, partial [Trametes versicolor FP-101664 SS1]|uniref:uncharacterized protein n=1 Tax=Trametes versicolor (strain FP-101664) TaxID=717944 RepID=UPI0004624769